MSSKPCSFHRLIRPVALDRGELVRKITASYFLSYLPDNKPYRPNRAGTIGMYLSGIWYRLDPKAAATEPEHSDCRKLQEKIVLPVFGTSCTATDHHVCYYTNEGWDQLLLAIHGDETVVAFTLFI